MKDRQYINNDWIFNPDFNKLPEGESVRIPHSVSITPFHYFDERIYQMISGYTKTISVPEDWNGKVVLLTFDGVAHCCEVIINGKSVGEHRSGYTAFTFDISSFIKYGQKNVIDVKVDSRESLNVPPFGFVIDYMTYGGIYRDVYIDVKEKSYIEDVFVSGDMNGLLKYEISLNDSDASTELIGRIHEAGSDEILFQQQINFFIGLVFDCHGLEIGVFISVFFAVVRSGRGHDEAGSPTFIQVGVEV